MESSRTGSRLTEMNKRGRCDQKDQKRQLQYRENLSLQDGHFVGTFQGIAFFQKYNACQNAGGKTNESENGVSVASCKSQDHTERTSEKHQAPDHYKDTQYESGYRSGTASGTELFRRQRNSAGAQDKPYDLRTDVLHRRRTVKSQRA